MPNQINCATCTHKSTTKCDLCIAGSKYRQRTVKRKRIEVKSKRGGAQLERMVRDRYNEARLQPNSGAYWARPLDVWLPGLLIEAKDRGHVTARGRKAYTIYKDDLEKAAQQAGSTPSALLFRFKDDNEMYIVMNYTIICALVAELQATRNQK